MRNWRVGIVVGRWGRGRPAAPAADGADRAGAWVSWGVGRRVRRRGPICLTTNRSFASWGEIFEDDTLAAAILDRLVGNAVVINIRGESYRMRTHRRLTKRPARE